MKSINSICCSLLLSLLVSFTIYCTGCGPAGSAGTLSGIYFSTIENFQDKGDVKLWVSFHNDGTNVLGGTRIIPDSGGSFAFLKYKNGHEPVTAVQENSVWTLEWQTVFGEDIGTISFDGILSQNATVLDYTYSVGSFSGTGTATRMFNYVTKAEADTVISSLKALTTFKGPPIKLNVSYDADEGQTCINPNGTDIDNTFLTTDPLAAGSFVYDVSSFKFDQYGGYSFSVEPTTDLPRLDCSSGCHDLGTDVWGADANIIYGTSQNFNWTINCSNFDIYSGCKEPVPTGGLFPESKNYEINGSFESCGLVVTNTAGVDVVTVNEIFTSK